jgi:hypothetical protein
MLLQINSSAITNGRSELKTKFGTWKFGAILIVFKDCQEILILTMMILLLVCLSAQLPRFGAAYPLKSVYQEKSKKRYGNSGNSFVCAVEFGDKVKAKSLLAGEIVVILNQNILMINRKCIKRAIQRRAFTKKM